MRVIGLGNPEAGDDAVGLIAARRARPELEGIPGVEVVQVGAGVHVLDLLQGAEAVVVVDAVRSPSGGRPPGTLVRVEAGPDGLPADASSSVSSHGFGVAEAVGLAAALGGTPIVVFIGVEAAEVAAGSPLSGPVEAALPALVQAVVEEVRRLAAP